MIMIEYNYDDDDDDDDHLANFFMWFWAIKSHWYFVKESQAKKLVYLQQIFKCFMNS